MRCLSDVDKGVLTIAGKQWKNAGHRTNAIRLRLGWSPDRFAVELNRLVDDPAALAWSPTLVNRLRRIRDLSPRGRWVGGEGNRG
jgi:Protein of unknown function (DUF3263)